MLGIKAFLIGLGFGSLMMLVGLQYHIVRTSDGVTIVARSQQPPLRSAFVDVRKWDLKTWHEYPEVASAIVKAGRGDLVVNAAVQTMAPHRPEPEPLPTQTGPAAESISPREAQLPVIYTQHAHPVRAASEIPVPIPAEMQSMPIPALPPVASQRSSSEAPPFTMTHIARPANGDSGSVVNRGYPILGRPIPIPPEPVMPPAINETEIASFSADESVDAASADREEESSTQWFQGFIENLIPSEDRGSPSASRPMNPTTTAIDYQIPSREFIDPPAPPRMMSDLAQEEREELKLQ